ncbi:MAG: RDD family protein [Bdellovibrionaceae bacterium]|nr:RDD family protein [Pseudobdellovibrionaceae bacterium]
MVYPDFSYQKREPRTDLPAIAPVADRMLAFLIDFLIFTPVFAFVTSGLLKSLRTMVLVQSDSTASWMLWFSLVSTWFALLVLAEALFVFYWGATPGQKFLKLEVRSYQQGHSLDLMQSLGRSFLHWSSFFFVLPVLAVYTHPLRRALHDRAFDTIVVTLKEPSDFGPIDLERNFFRSWSRMMAFVGAMALVGVSNGVRTSYERLNVVSNQDSAFCEDVDGSWKGQERLDRATGLFVAGLISSACLEKEANAILWKQEGSLKAFAELAKGLLNPEDEVSRSYLDRVCESSPSGEACAISKFASSTDPERGNILRKKGLGSLTARLLLVRETIDREQFASAAALIADLRQEALFDEYLAREEVRNIWKIKGKSQGREPASSDLRDIIRDFEERYELR